MKTLSIIIPAYNEEKTIVEVLRAIQAVPINLLGFTAEIIVVDDGSKDTTGHIVQSKFPQVIYIRKENGGKGSAVRIGIAHSTGDWVLIQDADMEYDPMDYLVLLKKMIRTDGAVYGSRTLGQGLRPHPNQSLGPWLAGWLLTCWTWLLFGRWITDTLTAYKLYPGNFIRSIPIQTHGFETDHELTAKLIRAKITISEVPITYHPRSVAEGKKIRARDGLIAVWTLLKFRIVLWINQLQHPV